jgi:cell division protein FtsB
MSKENVGATIESKKKELTELTKKVTDLRKEIKILEGKPPTTPNYEYGVKVD